MTTIAAPRNATLDDAVAAAEDRYVAANPRSAAQNHMAARHMPGGNTRTILFYDPFPLILVGGKGATVTDLDGHTYRDFLGEYTAGLYGHSHPAIVAAVRGALDQGIVLGAPNRHEARLAELVCQRFPACERVRFCNSGTEANLMAISLARAATGRGRLMAFDGAYHGGLLYFAAGGERTNVPFPVVTGAYNDANGARRTIAENAGNLAAIIVEPMMGAGGAIPGSAEFLRALCEEADRCGALLIFDEVMTSRLSSGGLQKVLGIAPDLTTFGKYLGGGMTFGAFGGRADLMDLYDPHRPDALLHSGTYNNNALTMAAGVVGLEQVFTPEAADRLNATGDDLRGRMGRAAAVAGVAVQVTGIGSILGLHFQDRPIARPTDAEATPAGARKLFQLEMLLRGFYVSRRGFFSLSVALEDGDYDAFMDAFADVLETMAPVLRS